MGLRYMEIGGARNLLVLGGLVGCCSSAGEYIS